MRNDVTVGNENPCSGHSERNGDVAPVEASSLWAGPNAPLCARHHHVTNVTDKMRSSM